MTLSLLVPQEALPKVQKRLDKLARSAGTTIEEIPGLTTLIADKSTLVCARLGIGPMPRVSGYEFAAKIEHTPSGNVISRAPSETVDLDAEWRHKSPHCDHCGKHRSRKETFLLRQHGIGLLQIGRNCLADFLMGDPTAIVAAAEFVRALGEEASDERWGSYGGFWEVSPVAYVACAVSSIERYGFRKSGEPGSTRIDADFLAGRRPSDYNARKLWDEGQPSEAQVARAKAIAEWVLTLSESELRSEYLWNLQLAMKLPSASKHAGLLASAPPAYDRAMGNAVKLKLVAQKRAAAAPGYAVEEGFIFEGECELIRLNIIAGAYSSRAICTFRAASGHEIVWFASGRAPTEIGARYHVKGRCKKHETYKGTTQTVLARVRWKGWQGMQNHEGNRPTESA